MPSPDPDLQAINAIIARQFASLNWGPQAAADWEAFRGDFLAEAALYPAARPIKRQTVEAFMARMQGLAGTALASLHERVLGAEVKVFGNVAVAMAGCEITENGSHVTRGVEMLLLVKTDGAWRIAAQAWDTEGPEKPLPGGLAGPNSPASR